MGLSSLTGLVVSIVMGFGAFCISNYMGGFLLNYHIPYLVPTTVDGGMDSPNPPRLLTSPLWNNLILLLGFGVQHSGMTREPVKRLALFVLSEDSFRVLYVTMSNICIASICYLWAPMPYLLWDIQQEPLRSVMIGIRVTTWIALILSLLNVDPFRLLGMRPYYDRLFNREKPEPYFVTTGLYALMRHPMYSFIMLFCWLTPTMSIGHMLFSVIFTGYILVAVTMYEEPELVKVIGPRYEEYQRTTPQYIPNLSSLRAALSMKSNSVKAQ